MADLSVFNISEGGCASIADSELEAAASSQTVAHPGKDSRLALRVANGGENALRVTVKAGNGPRAALGDLKTDVAAGETAYIALFDTARFKSLPDGAITVELTDTDGGELTSELELVRIEAVQM